MKKILVLALALMMVLSLAACGGKTDPAPSGGDTTDPGTQQTDPGTSEPGSTPDPGTQSDGDQFEKYGLLGIIPDEATDIVCVRDIAGYMEYTFTMPVNDKAAEQLAYQNACLDTIRAASDNGKVYIYTATYDAATAKMVGQYDERANFDELPQGGFGLIVFYYYNDTLHQITVSDNGSDTAHSYKVFLSPANNDSLPEK